MKKPGRPFGLSIAIAASVMLFSVFPLLDGLRLLMFRWRFQDFQMVESEFGQPAMIGTNFTGLSDVELLIHVILGSVFLVLAVFAWRGRPRWIRFAMILAVLAIMLYTSVVSLLPVVQQQQANLQTGYDSGISILTSFIVARLAAGWLISLFVLWYMNRAPARAFYRGYYLTAQNSADKSL